MDKVIELAREAGFTVGFSSAALPKHEKFYELARADLEAECERRKTQFASAEFAVNELKAENAKLKQKMVDGVTIQQYIDLDNECDVLKAELAAATSTNAKHVDLILRLEAEIAGWKADQKENLANQCELQAQINKLEAENAKPKQESDVRDQAGYLRGLEDVEKVICEHKRFIDGLDELFAAIDKLKGGE